MESHSSSLISLTFMLLILETKRKESQLYFDETRGEKMVRVKFICA